MGRGLQQSGFDRRRLCRIKKDTFPPAAFFPDHHFIQRDAVIVSSRWRTTTTPTPSTRKKGRPLLAGWLSPLRVTCRLPCRIGVLRRGLILGGRCWHLYRLCGPSQTLAPILT
ncbi:hypothetical protein KC338_g269 [Hortaea werneckii]|nr:hypothetical protein KC338_g269 [Hortaea werneckii]